MVSKGYKPNALLFLGVIVALSSVQAQEARVVALGGSVTEIVYALGAEAELVGVDQSSTYPADVRALPQVGMFRTLSAEGVLSLSPTLVLAVEGTGPPAVLTQIESAGVHVVHVPSQPSIQGTFEKVRTIAQALGRGEAGEQLINAMKVPLDHAAALLAQVENKPKVLFVYARGVGSLNVAGRINKADALIQLAGGVNAVTEYEGYRPLTAEAAVVAAPDVLMFLSRGIESIGGTNKVLELPGLALTPAGRAGRVVTLDDSMLGFGARLGEAVLDVMGQLHPNIVASPTKKTD